jgi:hypothetical protein
MKNQLTDAQRQLIVVNELLTVENNIFTLCYKKALQLKTACLPPNAYTLFHKKSVQCITHFTLCFYLTFITTQTNLHLATAMFVLYTYGLLIKIHYACCRHNLPFAPVWAQ